MPTQHKTIPDYLAALTPEQRATADALRALAAAAAPGLTEHIKWNAPSFVHDGEDRITLGSDKAGHIRVILHRGIRPKDANGFSFDAPADLVQWAAPDRGVMTFASPDEIAAHADEIGDVFRRWLEMK
jgi:hypothetical protein